MKQRFLQLSLILLLSTSALWSQATFMSITNGNWNDNGTWLKTAGNDEDGIPDANDTVRIAVIQTDTVTMNTNFNGACAKLEIGSLFTASGGFLTFASSTSSLTVGNVILYQSTDIVSRTIEIGNGTLTVSQELSFEATDSTSNHKIIVKLNSGILTVNGNILFHSSNAANAVLDMTSGAGRINLGGTITLDSVGTISTAGLGSIFNFSGPASQTVPLDIPGFVYENIYINNTSADGAKLNGNITTTNVTGNLKIQVGTLKTGSFSVTGNASKTIQIDSGGTLVLGDSSSITGFPTGYGTVVLNSSSTVIYAGGNQTVTNISGGYGNLVLESGLNSATKVMPGTDVTIIGSLTVQAGRGTSVLVTANSNLTIGKDVILGSGGVLGFGNFSHNVGRNWTNSGGLFSPSQSTITFNGSIQQTLDGPTYYNIVFSGSGTKVATASLAISGNLTISNGTIFNGGSFDHSVQKNWVKNGTFLSTGKVTFNGSSAQSIDSSGFYNIAFSNSGIKTPSNPLTILHDVTINNGAIFNGNSFSHTVNGDWTNNGTFTQAGTTIIFSGTDTQFVSGGPFNNVVINKTNGITLLTGNADIDGNFSVSSGTFNASSFIIDRTSTGGTFTLGNNSTFKLGGTNSFPIRFSTLSFSNSSTIEYSGTTQLLTLANYKNLVLSGTGTKTVGLNTNVAGNVTVQSGATIDAATFTVSGSGTSNLDIYGGIKIPGATLTTSYTNFDTISLKAGNTVEYSGGNQTIDSTLTYTSISFSGSGIKTILKTLSLTGGITVDAVIVNGSAFSHSFGGNWTLLNGGSFLTTGTITFNGSNQNISEASFNNVAFSGSGTKYATGNLTIGGTFTISSGAAFNAGLFTHSVQGNFVNNGTFFDSTSTFVFNGTNAQLIAGATFENVTLNNTNGASLTKSISINGTLNILSGNLTTNADSVILNTSATLTENGEHHVVGKIRTSRIILQNVTNTFGGIGIEINASATSPGQTVISRKTGTALSGTGVYSTHKSIKRYFDIAPAVNSNLNAVVTFHYINSEADSQNESKLSLWKTTNNGASWTKIAGTVDTSANTIVIDSVQSFHRFTAADSANNMTPVTITIRKFADADGNITTTNNWTKKKWNLQLRENSVNGTLLSEVINDSILSLSNLTEGTYVAVEADSARWKHLGYRKNYGTPTEDTTNNYVVISANGGETQTVEFVNYIPNDVTIKKVEDNDLNFSTSNDRTSKKWKLYLYKNSVSQANVLDSVDSDTMLVRGNLGDGTYVAKEADSTGWSVLGYLLDTNATQSTSKTITFTISGGQSRTVTFVNKHPAKIKVRFYRDTDGLLATTSDKKGKKWSMKLYKDSVSSASLIDTVKSDSVLTSSDLAAGTYIVTVADSGGNWTNLGTVIDSTTIKNAGRISDTVTVTAGNSKEIWFVHFNANNITVKAMEDQDGDINSSADRIAHNWHLRLYKDSISATKLLYEVTSDTQITALNLGDGTYYALQVDSTQWTDLRTIAYGTPDISLLSDTMTLNLTGGKTYNVHFLHYKPDKSKYRTFLQNDYTE
jgi:hypothetical protein